MSSENKAKAEYLTSIPVGHTSKEGYVFSFVLSTFVSSFDDTKNALYMNYFILEEGSPAVTWTKEEMYEYLSEESKLPLQVAMYTLLISWFDDEGYSIMSNLEVEPRWEGKGIGSLMLDTLFTNTLPVLQEVNPMTKKVRLNLNDNSKNSWTRRRLAERGLEPVDESEAKPSYVHVIN